MANEQPVNFNTASSSKTITNATAISVFAKGGDVQIGNTINSITIADGTSWNVTASDGNTLQDITVVPVSTALITWLQ